MVRETGTLGRILSVSLPWVTIGWEEEDSLVPRQESLRRSAARVHESIEIHTLNEGWVSLGGLLGARPHGRDELLDGVRGMVADAQELLERSKYYPFRYMDPLGPGPKKKRHAKTNQWVCKCSGYKCQCKTKKGKKRTKPIVINKSYKKKYNATYKAWLKTSPGKKVLKKKAAAMKGKKKPKKK